jgi:NAD(P)-dependent dehydrogenase (short-subunit alcohol dehydrogenase family)
MIILNVSIVASKGLAANSRTWTTDLKDRRIRVNTVSPGTIATPGLSKLAASAAGGEEGLRTLSQSAPMGRLGDPEEIARTVVFLASGDSSYVTGIELFVDGGQAQVQVTLSG